MTNKRVNFPADPARVDRQKAGGLFVYGPTKCALILRDMVTVLEASGMKVSKPIGRAFANIDEMLDLVTRRFLEIHATRRKNLLNEHDINGFKEHLVWNVANLETGGLSGKVPESVQEMFRTVAKERINMRKVELGISQAKSNVNYTTRDLITWAKTDIVLRARERWFIETMRSRSSKNFWY